MRRICSILIGLYYATWLRFFLLLLFLIGRQIFHVGWFDIFRFDKAFYQISVIREHRNYLKTRHLS